MITSPKKIFAVISLHAAALATPLTAFAGTHGISVNELIPAGDSGILHINNILIIVQNAIKFILITAFILAFIFLIIGGIRWIVAGGDEKGVAGARGMITAALIGLVIVLVSFALIRLIEVFFSISIISGELEIPSIPAP